MRHYLIAWHKQAPIPGKRSASVAATMGTRCVFLVAVAMCVAVARANFDVGDIRGRYNKVIGGDMCPQNVAFATNALQFPANSIQLNGVLCTSGSIVLQKNPGTGNALTKALRAEGDAEDILGGTNTGNLVCGTLNVNAGTVFNFVQPEDDFTFAWAQVFNNADTPLQQDGGPSFEFQEDREYLIISNACLYQKVGAIGDGGILIDTGPVCFPSSATVQMESGESRRMDKLAIGDRVLVGNGVYSDVFAWTHKDAAYTSTGYVRISTASGLTLTATPTHYVYANGRSVPAGIVRAGDTMTRADSSPATVTSVERVAERGLFNPQTVHGDIVVNGLMSTTYTTAIEPSAAHAMLAPMRAAYKAVRMLFTGPPTKTLIN